MDDYIVLRLDEKGKFKEIENELGHSIDVGISIQGNIRITFEELLHNIPGFYEWAEVHFDDKDYNDEIGRLELKVANLEKELNTFHRPKRKRKRKEKK